jgi:hypothetical protein
MTKPKTPPKKTQPKKTQPKKTKQLEPFSFTSTLPAPGDEDGGEVADDGPEPLQTLNVRDGVFRVFKELCVTSKVTMMRALEDVLTEFCNRNGRAVPPSRRKRRR